MASAQLEKALELAPIVERVHGPHHPEMARVRELTDAVNNAGKDENLDEVFAELRKLTDNYVAPEDTCETVEALYAALESVDQGR